MDEHICILDIPGDSLKRAYLTVSCRKCKLSKKIKADIFLSHPMVKVKCPCGCETKYILNRRHHHRKKVNIPVEITLLSESPLRLVPKTTGIIKDISVTGMGISTSNYKSFNKGDIVELRFKLPTYNEFLVKRGVVMCHDDKLRRMGVKYIDDGGTDKRISLFMRSE